MLDKNDFRTDYLSQFQGVEFDTNTGLWSQPNNVGLRRNAGDLADRPRLTEVRRSAERLLAAAKLGRLGDLPVTEVLRGLHRQQCRDDSPAHGNFHWFAEAHRVTDTNAAFFIGQPLCTLRLAHADQFDDEQHVILDDLCEHLMRWFDHAVPDRMFYYPNKYLGDLVCGWLLHEITGEPPMEALIRAMHDAANYWVRTGWGWGEHLSDIYAEVMFDQLVGLLSLSQTLPEDLRQKYTDLFLALTEIERAFAGGPRVPVLRSYAFTQRPETRNPCSRLREGLEHDAITGKKHYLEAMRALLERVPDTPPNPQAQREVSIPCLRGATADAWITPDVRLGSMSHFPIMPEAEFPQWGLAWQSFPVALIDGDTGWGFLRWRSREDGIDRAQPSLADKTVQLSATTIPSFVGHTACRQRGPRVVVIRRMPVTSQRWDFLSDAIEFIGMPPDDVTEHTLPDGSQTLRLRRGDRVWRFGHHPLVSEAAPLWIAHNSGGRWEVNWPHEDLTKYAPPFRIAHLWWIACGDGPDPTIRPQSQTGTRLSDQAHARWSVHWPEATGDTPAWQLETDLNAQAGATLVDANWE